MKLVRYGAAGREAPGLLAPDGTLRDLTSHVADIGPEQLSAAAIAQLRAVPYLSLPIVDDQRLGIPLTGVRKFLAIGLNYRDHADESGMRVPDEPVLFTKAISCLSGPCDDICLPRGSVKTDWEVEMGVIIGATARYVDERRAMDHVAGFVLVNDVSERTFQLEGTGTWDKGKGCDTFGPVGPWLVTKDEISDPRDVDLWLNVNGRPMQKGNTRMMIFSIRRLVSYVSHFLTLEAGDILATGTPAGIGSAQVPQPIFLRDGDLVTLGSSKLGMQRQRVVAATRLE